MTPPPLSHLSSSPPSHLFSSQVLNFPFPTPPDPLALRAAHRCLEALSAIEAGGSEASTSGQGGGPGALTALGRAMSAFPISPRHARMLLEVVAWQSQQSQQVDKDAGLVELSKKSKNKKGSDAAPRGSQEIALPYAVALAAALSVESPFIHVDNVVSGV